jgi:hypothetical protein
MVIIFCRLEMSPVTGSNEKESTRRSEESIKYLVTIINPFNTAMRLQHYLGKLFVAFARFPIEGKSDGEKTTDVLTGN